MVALLCPFQPAAAPPQTNLSIQTVLQDVLASNPELNAARARWEAAKQKVPQARAWPDPHFGVNVGSQRTEEFRSETMHEVMLAQSLPISGRNKLEARAAAAFASAAFEELRQRELDLTAEARTAYYGYATAQAQLEVSRQSESTLQELIAIARRKQAEGRRPAADSLAAETYLSVLLKERAEIQREYSHHQTALNVLMNRPAYSELLPPPRLEFKPLALSILAVQSTPHGQPEKPFSFAWPVLEHRMLQHALAQRPEIVGVEHKIRAATAQKRAASRARIPEPEFRFEVGEFDRRGAVIGEYKGGLFFNLPWFNYRKYRAALEEAEQELAAAQADLAAIQARTAGMIRTQVQKIEAEQTHFEAVRDSVLPTARQTFLEMKTAYNAEQVNFFDLLSAQRILQKYEFEIEEHLASYLSAIAELERLAGLTGPAALAP